MFRFRFLLAYALMIVATIVAFELISHFGTSGVGRLLLAAPTAPLRTVPHPDILFHVLLTLIVVILAARLLGELFRLIHQPPVIGEVVAGILLGPSLLGRIAPSVASYVLPDSTAPYLQVLAQIGVILYMFIVGLELNTSRLRQAPHATIAVSHAGIVIPFILGSLLALWIYPHCATSDVPFRVFAMFLGVSMSVTAFPVLARILTDRRMQHTELGAIALSCAAVGDATAWCLLAFVTGFAQARASSAMITVALTVAFIVVMIVLVRPVLVRVARAVDAHGSLSQGAIAGLVAAFLTAALASEMIGIHAIFGAFLLGAMIPHGSLIAREFTHRLEDIVVCLFLPAFFAYTGMRTQVNLVSSTMQWAICAAIIVVACLGKFGGSAVPAWLTGRSPRQSAALGVLMNTRGLMELIVLNVGLELDIISPTLFAMLVIMAVVTTLLTAPVLSILLRGGNET